MPKISVVIPYYNAAKYIKDCVESIKSQIYPSDEYEIIFVDNNSTDSSVNILKRYSGIKLVSERKQGSYAARNRGIRESIGQIIAFTDPDCIASSDWLLEIEKAMSDPLVSVVLGRRLMSKDSLLLSLLDDYENEKNIYTFRCNESNRYFGHTSNMAVRKELFNDLGLFIEKGRGSDSIFVNAVVKKYSVKAVEYSESIKVRHMEIEKLLDYYKKLFIYGRSRKLYKSIANIRPISYKQRLSIYKNVIMKRDYTFMRAGILFYALLAGIIFWKAGTFSALIYRN